MGEWWWMMAETEFKYDVFISYSSANKDWVRKDLLSALEKAGLKVCIDFRDFERGAPSVEAMVQAIQASRKTLLVLTPEYIESVWTKFEYLILETIDPANRQRRLIPLLKEKCKLPVEIGYLTYIDFAEPWDKNESWKQLFDTLGKPGNLKPATSNWFYGHRYGDLATFTGRADELKMLSDWLDNDKENLLIIRALGGFGKSALTWQWFNNKVDREKWHTAIWWSFYEKDLALRVFLLKH